MTKNFKELISEYKIIIPLIQRDYAQGRKSEKTKANNFLDAILDGTMNGLNLDFIYGKIEIDENNKKVFIPLDGQQRLTTLLLIYWFISLENEHMENLQNFNYEVRASTKDFIKQLMSKSSWENFKKSNIKKSIENSNWFFLSWKNDPTVVAILDMLDLIEQKFIDIKIDDLDKITFEFLNLNDFDLEDELYVKMNARGKPLTEFENFKSHFENFIKFDNKDEEYETKAKLDNQWLNIFWEIAQEKVNDISDSPKIADEMFYNFFYNMTLNFYLEKGQVKIDDKRDYKISIFEKGEFKEKETENLTTLIKDKLYVIKNENEIYVFNTINDFIKNIAIFDFYQNVYKDRIYVENVIKILDKVSLTEEFKSFIFKKTQKESDKSDSKDISYWERARFYALGLGYINDLQEEEFKHWKRVSFNLINNQLIQGPEDLISTLQSLKNSSDIYKNKNSIYDYIKGNKDNIDYFLGIQRDEESIKANLILNDNSWENELIEAEKHWYLNGQVGFLLRYSQKDNDYNLESFKEYRDKFIALWNFAQENKDNQILLYRALLTKGDYLSSMGSNRTFCSFDGTSVRVKNDNWRKVFNDNIRTIYFKKLLDDIDKNKIKDSSEKIIQKYLQDKKYCDLESFQDKYLYVLISNDKNIKYCENLQLRYYQDGKEVYLLKKNQMNGAHVELYSWNLFNEKFEQKSKEKRSDWWRVESDTIFDPFKRTWYFESTNNYDKPCIVLDQWDQNGHKFILKIYFDFENEKYEINFIESNKKQIPKEIIEILETSNFKKEKEYLWILKTNYTLCKEDELITYIKNLTKNLADLTL